MKQINLEVCEAFRNIRLEKTKDENTGKVATQAEFAKMLDISQSAVAEIEAGKREPSKKIILKIIDKFEINIYHEVKLSKVKSEKVNSLNITTGFDDLLKSINKYESEISTLKTEVEQLRTERDEWKEQAKLLREMLTRSQGNH